MPPCNPSWVAAWPPEGHVAWFKIDHFRVAERGGRDERAEGAVALAGQRGFKPPRARRSGGAAEALVAEDLQPVAVLLSAEQFRWTLAHPLGVRPAQEPSVGEEEPEQFPIVLAYFLPQEEVVPQSTIQVLPQP